MNETKILEVLRASKSRALHVAELCTLLDVPKSERRELNLVLERMAEEKLVTQLPGGKFRIGQKKPHRGSPTQAPADGSPPDVAGTPDGQLGRLVMHPRGFGFVATVEPGPDVFVLAQNLGGAMHADKVRVRSWKSRQGFEGEVLSVEERGTKIIGGTLHVDGRQSWIEPDDARIRGPVRLAEPAPEGATSGTALIAEITRYPKGPEDFLTARIVEMLTDDRIAEFEMRKIFLRDGVALQFADDVLEEAKTIPKEVPEADKRGREDLRHLALCAIDPVDARDHDDAVWAEKTDDGYRVIVAIADVSHYVRPGTAIDREALERGCTIYLPDRAIPMLPPELSTNLASLVPGVDRLTLAVEMHLDRHGAVTRRRYIEGLMRCPATLFYEGVANALGLADDVPAQPAAQEHLPLLRTLLEVAGLRNKLRRERGSLELSVAEPKVKLEADTGNPSTVERARKNPGVSRAYNLVEELMLLANETVAADLTQRGMPVVYRVHGTPDAERIESFAQVATSLGYTLDADDARNPMKLAAFIRKIEGTPHAGTLGYLLLRAMQQATYDTNNVGHFGLGAPEYLHFTSPIRRYPDLVVHRVVRAIARNERMEVEELKGKLQLQAVESSRLERRAMKIEREAVDLYRCLLMRDRVGDTFDGQITGIAEHGLFVSLDDPFVEVLVRYASLGTDSFTPDEHGLRVTGARSGLTFALGDRVNLTIEEVVVARRQIVGVFAGHVERAKRPAGGGRKPQRKADAQKSTSREGSRGGDRGKRDGRGSGTVTPKGKSPKAKHKARKKQRK